MLGKLGLVLVLFLSASAARAMPGTASTAISPTVPYADDPIDPRSDFARPSQHTVLRNPVLFREECET